MSIWIPVILASISLVGGCLSTALGYLWARNCYRAVVTGTSGSLVTIKRTGQPSADPQSYPHATSYTSPTNGDEVIVIEVAGTPFVLCKVAR